MMHAQDATLDVPASRDWYFSRVSWLRERAGSDSTAGYRSMDSLTQWAEAYGTAKDRNWLSLTKARFWMRINRYPLALSTMDQMLDSSENPVIQAHTQLTLRDLHSEIEAYDLAIQFHQMIDWEVIPEAPEAKSPTSFIAFTYAKIGSYAEAITTLKKSIEELRAVGMHYYVVSYTNSLGVFYMENNDLDSALVAYQEAQRALEHFFPNGAGLNPSLYKFFGGLIKGNIAQVLAKQGKHYEAIPLLKLDIDASLAGEPTYQYRENGVLSLIHLSNSYIATDQLELAEQALKRARSLLTQQDDTNNWVAYLKAKASLARALGAHEDAFELLQQAETMDDSASAVSKKDRASNLIRTYRYSLDREIMERTEEVQRLRERNAQQRQFNIVFIGLIGFTLFSSIYFTVLYRQNKARRKDLELKNRQIEEQKNLLEVSLNEQEVLLREVNHRVKNNLQVISSMLFLEQRKVEDKALKQTLRDVQERIRTMSNIHQKLYMRQQIEGTEKVFEAFVCDLVNGIIHSYSSEAQEIVFTPAIYLNELSVDQTIPLSLILHELTTNSLKHAFQDADHGTIRITMREVVDEGKPTVLIEYSDDGPGLDEDQREQPKRDTIGMKLIELLTHQLRGTLHIQNQDGFRCEIRFPSQSAQPTFAV
jgi:two-component sensor histidine kinase